jgi:nicotinamidase-related amidase
MTDVDYRGNPLPPGERLLGAGLAFGSRDVQVVDDIAPMPGDYVIWKRRWSPFYQTRFELSLRTRGVDTIVLNGGSVEIGIASTLYAIQTLDFDVVVVSDGCTSDRPDCRDALMKQVFPVIGRVRTTDQVLALLGSA